MNGTNRLVRELVYIWGLGISECMKLRIKDIFEVSQLQAKRREADV